MAYYVDKVIDHPKTAAWPFGAACHLFADTEEELHALARLIGLRREWFQADSSLPHYDLTPGKRFLALKKGAHELTPEQVRYRIRERRRSEA